MNYTPRSIGTVRKCDACGQKVLLTAPKGGSCASWVAGLVGVVFLCGGGFVCAGLCAGMLMPRVEPATIPHADAQGPSAQTSLDVNRGPDRPADDDAMARQRQVELIKEAMAKKAAKDQEEAGRAKQEEAERVRRDGEAKKLAEEEGDAERALAYAKKLVDQKSGRAADRLREVIDKHPRTKAAEEARKLLEKISP